MQTLTPFKPSAPTSHPFLIVLRLGAWTGFEPWDNVRMVRRTRLPTESALSVSDEDDEKQLEALAIVEVRVQNFHFIPRPTPHP